MIYQNIDSLFQCLQQSIVRDCSKVRNTIMTRVPGRISEERFTTMQPIYCRLKKKNSTKRINCCNWKKNPLRNKLYKCDPAVLPYLTTDNSTTHVSKLVSSHLVHPVVFIAYLQIRRHKSHIFHIMLCMLPVCRLLYFQKTQWQGSTVS